MFKAYADTDHVTEATGKTIAITISKNGGAFGNPNAGATNATEVSSGWYKVTLDTTDTGTVGPLAVRGTNADIDDVGVLYYVVKATNGGWTALPDTAVTTNASLITSGTGTAQLSVSSGKALLQDGAVTAAVIATGAIDADALAADASGEIADAVLREAVADHAGVAGSLAEYVDQIASLPAVNEIVDAMFTANTGQTAATAVDGSPVKEILDALPTAASNATAVWAAGTRSLTVLDEDSTTLDLDATIRAAVGLAAANLDTQIGDLPTNAELAAALAAADDAVLAAIAALNNLSAAQVNAEVVDALATDTYAEPTGVPAATATLAAKIGVLHMALRNQITVEAGAKTVFDDGGAAEWKKVLSDDGTTYTEGEATTP